MKVQKETLIPPHCCRCTQTVHLPLSAASFQLPPLRLGFSGECVLSLIQLFHLENEIRVFLFNTEGAEPLRAAVTGQKMEEVTTSATQLIQYGGIWSKYHLTRVKQCTALLF